MNVSSVLDIMPFSNINPVYNGTKAWLHFWTMDVCTQLSNDGNTDVRAVEIMPPSVGADLHREREDPDDNKKEKGADALTISGFMMEIAEQMEQGKEVTSAGMGLKSTGGTALWVPEMITKQQRPIQRHCFPLKTEFQIFVWFV